MWLDSTTDSRVWMGEDGEVGLKPALLAFFNFSKLEEPL